MPRRRRIYEAKAKTCFEGPEPGTIVQYFKDDTTAFNNKKKGTITGKGVINNRISEFLMTKLGEIGVPTHFIRRVLRRAFRRRGRHAAAALDHGILLQERPAQRSDGDRGAHHRVRLGDAS